MRKKKKMDKRFAHVKGALGVIAESAVQEPSITHPDAILEEQEFDHLPSLLTGWAQ